MADKRLISKLYPVDALQRVVDARLVEHLHGPNDGEFRRVDDNGYRSNGLYIVVLDQNEVVFKQFTPFDG